MIDPFDPGDIAYLEYFTGDRHIISRRHGYTVCGKPLTERSRRTRYAFDPMCQVCASRSDWRVAQPVTEARAVGRTARQET